MGQAVLTTVLWEPAVQAVLPALPAVSGQPQVQAVSHLERKTISLSAAFVRQFRYRRPFGNNSQLTHARFYI
jgi:hypothetical protein